MSNSPLITIAVPTYNSVGTLSVCIESILNQALTLEMARDLEVIVVDNGSVDNTSDVCSEYVLKFGNFFRYYRNSTNIGYDKNIGMLFAKSRGKFVKILCDDDAFDAGAISAFYIAVQRHPEVDLILSNFNVYDKNLNQIIHQMSLCQGRDELFKSPIDFFESAMGRYGQTSSLMIRRDAWNSIPCQNAYGTMHIQVYMTLRLLQTGSSLILSQPWIKVRAGSPNFSSSLLNQFTVPLEGLKIYEDFLNFFTDKIYRDLASQQRDYVIEHMRHYHGTVGLSPEHVALHNLLAEKIY